MSGSMSAQRGFKVIGEEDPPAGGGAPSEAAQALVDHNRTMLLLALRALSQRALTAITNLMTIVLVASVWFLAWTILPQPTPLQLGGVGGYAFFVLLIEMVRRRRGRVHESSR